MESIVFYNQFEKLKNNLYLDVQAEMNKLNEKVQFTNIRCFVDNNDSDRVCIMYAIENNKILVDSAIYGLEALNLNELNLENLLFVKEQIEIYQKNKYISSFV